MLDFQNSAYEEFERMKQEVRQAIASGELLIAYDIETTGLSPIRNRMIGYSFANSRGSWYADLYPNFGVSFTEGREFLSELLSNPEITLIGANIKFDMSFARMAGIDIKAKYIELQALMHIINENAPKALKEMAKTFLGIQPSKFKDVQSLIGGFLHSQFRDYGRADAEMTFKLYPILYNMVAKKNRLELFNIINFQIKIAMEMQLNGFMIDQDVLDALETEYVELLTKYRDAIYKEAGYEFNIDSNEQLFILLKNKGIDLEAYGAAKGKKRLKSSAFIDYCDSGKLKLIAEDEDDYVPMFSTGKPILSQVGTDLTNNVLGYKKASKVLSSFIKSFRPLDARSLSKKEPVGCDSDGYLRSNFNPIRTKTGRWAAKSPNQQQIPPHIRKCFVASPGYKLIVADYSQLELRIIAHYTQDELLVNAYNTGIDVHQQTADKLGIDRQQAKICNFSIAYLTGPKKLAKFLKISEEEAKKVIKDFLSTFKGIKRFHAKGEAYVKNSYPKYAKAARLLESLKARVKATDLDMVQRETLKHQIPEMVEAAERLEPKVEMLFGRTRRLGYLGEKKILPTIINTKIQGTAGDIVNSAFIEFYGRRDAHEILSPVRILAQVHDEIVIETIDDEEHVLQAVHHLRESMEKSVKLTVKLEADIGTGYSWAAAKSKESKYTKDLDLAKTD